MIGNIDVLLPCIWHDGRYKPVTCAKKKVTLLKQYEDCPTWHLREEGFCWWRSGTAHGETTASIVVYYLCIWQALYMVNSHIEGFYSSWLVSETLAKATPVQAFLAVKVWSSRGAIKLVNKAASSPALVASRTAMAHRQFVNSMLFLGSQQVHHKVASVRRSKQLVWAYSSGCR